MSPPCYSYGISGAKSGCEINKRAAFFIAGLALLANYAIISVCLLHIGALILTAYEGREVNLPARTYWEYTSFLFFKKGQQKKFDGIERIFINSGKVSQKIYKAHTASSSTFTSVEYSAYLKFDNGVKVFLMSKKSKAKLMDRLKDVGVRLNTSIADNTVPVILPNLQVCRSNYFQAKEFTFSNYCIGSILPAKHLP